MSPTPTELNRTLLHTILSRPSAPFREGHVIRAIVRELTAANVPFFHDPVGNIIVGVKDKHDYLRRIAKRTKEPLRIFVAHMDHPGFHGQTWLTPETLSIRWHGGSPTHHLEGARVWLADQNGWFSEGALENVKILASGRAIESATVRLAGTPDRKAQARSLFGGFAFRSPFWEEGELIYTKAADDLVGAFAIVQLAIDSFASKSKRRPPFIGILSRAEEVGFIGVIGHMELGWFRKAKRPLLAISLETSRTLPGAEIGKGPVVRLGDKFTTFHSGAMRVFTDLAEKALPARHQRRIMDGGTCEASAATVYGLPAIGISIPLGNYHNQSFEGGPDSRGEGGPAPEFVHRGDVAGLLDLCRALLERKLNWRDPWAGKRTQFRSELKKYKPLLRSVF